MRRLLLATVAAGALAASAAASSGWQTHAVPAAGFAIAAPPAWIDVTSSSPAVLASVAKNPELRQDALTARQNKLIKLICASAAGFPNMNVIVIDARIGLKAFVAANLSQIKGLSYVHGAVTTKSVRLPSGGAVEVRFLEAPAGTLVATEQYYLVHGSHAYVVTYTSVPASAAHDEPTFLRSVRSLRFVTAPA